MILVDTNVLVGLIDPLDGLHARARRDLARMEKKPLAVISPVVTETLFHLRNAHLRTILRRWFNEADVVVITDVEAEGRVDEVLAWLLKYEKHEPDFADGCLAILSGVIPKVKVWTYDSEFRTIWRRPDGSKIPLAVRA